MNGTRPRSWASRSWKSSAKVPGTPEAPRGTGISLTSVKVGNMIRYLKNLMGRKGLTKVEALTLLAAARHHVNEPVRIRLVGYMTTLILRGYSRCKTRTSS